MSPDADRPPAERPMWLGEAVEGRARRAGALVLLAGEAGVGKTHLAEAALRGAVLLRGAAQPPAADPVRTARGGAAVAPATGSGRVGLRSVRCAAHLAERLPELGPPGGGPAIAPRCSRPSAVRLQTLGPALVLLRRPAVVRRCERSSCWPRSRRRCGSCRCWSSPRTGPMRSAGPSVPATARRPAPRPAVARDRGRAAPPGGETEWRRAILGGPPPRRWPMPCMTAPRACRSSFRSSRRRAASGRRVARGRGGARALPRRSGPGPGDPPGRGAAAHRRDSADARAAAEAAASPGSRVPARLVAGLDELLRPAWVAETEPGPRRVPPRAGPRRDLRGHPVAAPPRATRALAQRARRRRAAPSAEVAAHGGPPASANAPSTLPVRRPRARGGPRPPRRGGRPP